MAELPLSHLTSLSTPGESIWGLGYLPHSVHGPDLRGKGPIVTPNGVIQPWEDERVADPESFKNYRIDKKGQKLVSNRKIGNVLIPYQQFINSYEGPQDIGLSRGNRKMWQTLGADFMKLNRKEVNALDSWIGERFMADRTDILDYNRAKVFSEAKEAVQWTFNRAFSEQPIWWGAERLAKWNSKNYDVKLLISLGDLLRFDEAALDYRLEITSSLEADLLRAFKSSPSLAESEISKMETPAEVESAVKSAVRGIRGLKDKQSQKSIYDVRTEQVLQKILDEETQNQSVNRRLGKMATSQIQEAAIRHELLVYLEPLAADGQQQERILHYIQRIKPQSHLYLPGPLVRIFGEKARPSKFYIDEAP